MGLRTDGQVGGWQESRRDSGQAGWQECNELMAQGEAVSTSKNSNSQQNTRPSSGLRTQVYRNSRVNDLAADVREAWIEKL